METSEAIDIAIEKLKDSAAKAYINAEMIRYKQYTQAAEKLKEIKFTN